MLSHNILKNRSRHGVLKLFIYSFFYWLNLAEISITTSFRSCWISLTFSLNLNSNDISSHQWPGGSVFWTSRREVTCSIPERACRPRRSEFSMFFSKTRVNTDPLERFSRRTLPFQAQSLKQTKGLNTTANQCCFGFLISVVSRTK